MAKPTYGQVVALHKTLQETDPRYKNVSLDQFVKGNKDFEAAVSGSLFKAPARALSVDMEQTGLPDVGAKVGGAFGSLFDDVESTRYQDIYSGVGRGMAQSIPSIAMMFAGPAGVAAAAGTAGAQTYEESNDPVRGLFSAATMGALPGVANLGGKIAVSQGARIPSLAPKLLSDTVANRLTNIAGSTVAGQGFMTGADLFDRFALGDKPGLGDMTAGEYLAMQTVSQIPFSALDVPRLFPGHRGNYVPGNVPAQRAQGRNLVRDALSQAITQAEAAQRAVLTKVAKDVQPTFASWADPNKAILRLPEKSTLPDAVLRPDPAKPTQEQLDRTARREAKIKAIYGIQKTPRPTDKKTKSTPAKAASGATAPSTIITPAPVDGKVTPVATVKPEAKAKPAAKAVVATNLPPPEPRVSTTPEEKAIVQQTKLNEQKVVETLPEVKDDTTAGTVAATVVEVAERSGVNVKDDDQRAVVIEGKLGSGDNVAELLTKDLEGEKTRLIHKIEMIELPAETTQSVRDIISDFNKGLQEKLTEAQKIDAKPEERQKITDELNNENRIVSNHLLSAQGDPNLTKIIRDAHEDWLSGGKIGGHKELGTRISNEKKKFKDKDKRQLRQLSGESQKKKEAKVLEKDALWVDTWNGIETAAGNGDPEMRKLNARLNRLAEVKKFAQDSRQLMQRVHEYMQTEGKKTPEDLQKFVENNWATGTSSESGVAETYQKDGTWGSGSKSGPVTFESYDAAEMLLDALDKPNQNEFSYNVTKRADKRYTVTRRARNKFKGGAAVDAADYATEDGVTLAAEENMSADYDPYADPGDPEGGVVEAQWMYIPVDKAVHDAQFAGEVAYARRRAKELGLKEGMPLDDYLDARNEQLRRDTGFHIDPRTGRLLFEISDSKIVTELRTPGIKKLWQDGAAKLEDVFSHHDLYKMYPEMRGMKVILIDNGGGYYDHGNKTIALNRRMVKFFESSKYWQSRIRAVLLHEIQHGVWASASMPRGSSPEAFATAKRHWKQFQQAAEFAQALKLNPQDTQKVLESVEWRHLKPMTDRLSQLPAKEIDLILKDINRFKNMGNVDLYWATYGEIIARDTEARRNLTSQDRQEMPPMTRGNVGRTGKVIPLQDTILWVHGDDNMLFGHVKTRSAHELYHKLLTEDGYSKRSADTVSQFVKQLAKVYGQWGPIAWKELKDSSGAGRLGLFLNVPNGPKAIALKVLEGDFAPHKMMAVAGHESGHLAVSLLKEGKLPADMAAPLNALNGVLAGMDQVNRRRTVEEAYALLMPKELRADAVLAELTSNLHDVNELTANLLSIAHTAAAYEKPMSFAEKLGMLPVHVMNAVRSGLRFMRDWVKTLTSAGAYDRHSAYGKLDIDMATESLRDFTHALGKQIDAVNKQGEIVRDFSNAYKMVPGNMKSFFDETHSAIYTQELPQDTRVITEWMTGSSEMLGTLKDWFINHVLPPLNLADADPRVQQVMSVPLEESSFVNKMTQKAKIMLFANDPNKIGPQKIKIEQSSVYRVMHNEAMTQQLNSVKLMENKKRASIFDLLAAKDQEALELVSKMTPEQRTDVLETTLRMHKVEQAFASEFYHSTRSTKEHMTAQLLVKRGLVPPKAAEAKEAARRLYDITKQGLATGDTTMLQQIFMAMGADQLVADNMTKFMISQVSHLEKVHKLMKDSPWFVSEKRMDRYQVTVMINKTKSTGLYDFKTLEEAEKFIEQYKNDPDMKVVDSIPRDTWEHKKVLPSGIENIYDVLAREEAATVAQVTEAMTQLGVDPAAAEEIANGIKFMAGVKEYESSRLYGTLNLRRKHKLGRESLNMMEQQMKNVRSMSRTMSHRYSDSYLGLLRMDPEIYNYQTKALTDRIEETIRNYRVPDTETGRALSSIGFFNFVALNPSNMILEQFGWLTSLAPKLTEEGAGLFGGYKRVQEAIKITTDIGLGNKVDPEIERLLYDAEIEGRRGLGFLSEIEDVFGNIDTDPNWMSNPLAHLAKLSAAPYQAGVKLNETVSLIAAYKHVRDKHYKGFKTLDKAQWKHVHDETIRIAAMTNNTIGKVNRPTFLFGSEKPFFRTSAQALYSLQSYVGMTYANTIRQYRRGFDSAYKNLPADQRSAAKMAFAQALTTFIALAGVSGIPMLMPIDKLQEGFTKVSIKDSIMGMVRSFGGEENGDFFADVASHGLAHAFGLPFDLSQRIAPAGMFGFNSYDGFSLDQLAGPVWGIYQNLLESRDAALKGDWTQMYKKALPPVLGSSAALWKNNGTLTDNHGNTLSAPSQTWANKLAYVLGFKPSEIVRHQDQADVARKANDATTGNNAAVANEVAALLLNGDFPKAMQLLQAVKTQSQGLIEPVQVLESALNLAEGRRFGLDVRDLPTLGASLQYDHKPQPTGPPTAGKMERVQWRNQMRTAVGIEPYTMKKFRSAMLIDAIQGKNPSVSTARARAIAESLVQFDQDDFLGAMSGLGMNGAPF